MEATASVSFSGCSLEIEALIEEGGNVAVLCRRHGMVNSSDPDLIREVKIMLLMTCPLRFAESKIRGRFRRTSFSNWKTNGWSGV